MTEVRYIVRGPIEGKLDDYYIMEDGSEMTFFDDRAQADICAWALNAVARGMALCATYETYSCDVCQADAIAERYTGPTQGIAPLWNRGPR